MMLFLSVKRELRERDRIARALADALESQAARIRQLEREVTQFGAPVPAVTSSINLTKRVQALRRMREGEGPEQIASALNLPVAEVKLLEKVNRIVSAD
jgi:DNA-binding NarL/FixJ family response regulator